MALITGLTGFSFLLALAGLTAAQSLDMGARGLGLANAVVSISRLPYEPANPACPTGLPGPVASFSFGQAHGLSELRHASALAVYPFRRTALAALTLQSFGFDAYRRLTASAVISTPVTARVRLGIRLTHRRVAITGYGTRSATGVSAGWTVEVTPDIRAGGSWRYIGASLTYEDRLLPQELDLGFEARASPTLRLLAAVALENGTDADIRIGTEVFLAAPVALRVGTGTNPDRIALGLGLKTKPATIDAAVSIHRILGPSFAVSLSLE